MKLADLAAIAAIAKKAGVKTVVDNTFMTPFFQRPLEFGIDVVVHSTTKYLNGHSDVVGGCVIAANAALADELKWWGNALGVTGAPFDSYLTLRGLRTLHIRIKQHVENAEARSERPAAELVREEQGGLAAVGEMALERPREFLLQVGHRHVHASGPR